MVDEMPEGRSFYGMDFGYTQDPTTLIECKIIGDNLYLNELIYQTGLRNSDIVNLMKQLNIRGVVYGDSAEPKTIDDLYFAGFNIHGAIKGPDSINFGLTIMKQFTIFVTKKSTNLVKEFRNYTYMKDKEGKMLNKPIDLWNHGIDATRYGVSMEQRKKLEYKEMNTITNTRRL
jgi:phage terminase large subunit